MGEWVLPAGGLLGVLAVLRFAAVPIAQAVVILVSGIYANIHPDPKRRSDSQRVYELADRDRPPAWPLRRAREESLAEKHLDHGETAG